VGPTVHSGVRRGRPATSTRALRDRWFVDETYVKVAGRWTYLYRAIDQHGQVIDIWLSRKRDSTAARAFFSHALAAATVPVEVTTDRAPVYPRVLDELVPSAMHRGIVKTCGSACQAA
jgi:transposase, IS6 family